jgi:hypothetical protein
MIYFLTVKKNQERKDMTINFLFECISSHPPPTIAFFVRFMRCARFEWLCSQNAFLPAKTFVQSRIPDGFQNLDYNACL